NNLILPILLTFKPEQFEYVVKYAKHIVLLNPVRDGNYLDLKFIESKKIVHPNINHGLTDDCYELNQNWILEFNPDKNTIYFKDGISSHQYDLKSIYVQK